MPAVTLPGLGELTVRDQRAIHAELVARGLLHPSTRASDVAGALQLIANPRGLASAADHSTTRTAHR